MLLTTLDLHRCMNKIYQLKYLLLCILVMSISSSCAHINEMETRLLSVEDQLKDMRLQTSKQKQKQDSSFTHIDKEFKGFREEIFKSIDNLRKGNVDDSVNIDQNNALIQSLRGQIDELKFKLSKFKPNKTLSLNELPKDKNELYAMGVKLLQNTEYNKAIQVFKAFVKQYPNEIRADESLFYIAESYHQQGKYDQSIEVIQKILIDYKDKNQADQSLILLHDNYLALDSCGKAIEALNYLKKNYPRSNQLRLAKKKLKKLSHCRR
jgi:TolA-binding protein